MRDHILFSTRTFGWAILFALLSGAFNVQTLSAETPPFRNPSFGIIESLQSPNDAHDLGVGWTRVRIHWGETQPDNPTQWVEQRVYDWQIDAEVEAGREVVGIIIGIPDWARDERLLPKGLALPYDDPNNSWTTFLRQAVTRYQGKITHWIIWNEPDVWQKGHPGHTWDGDERDFARLMKVSYQTIKEIDPTITVHLAAMTYFWDANYDRVQYLDRLLGVIKADPESAENNHWFDIATAHLYFQPGQLYDIIHVWNEIMAKHGIVKPWWLVEANAPPSDDPAWVVDPIMLKVSQVDQANYIPAMIASAFSVNVNRIGLFKLRDIETDLEANPEPYGLVRLDGSRRPAFQAYQFAVRLLQGVQSAERERWDDLGQFRLESADDRLIHILFARKAWEVTVEIPARTQSAELFTAMGERTLLSAENGVFTVTLPASPCTQPLADYCMIGGTSYYLVQASPATATPIVPTLAPTAPPLPTFTPTVGHPVETVLNTPKTVFSPLSRFLLLTLLAGVVFWLWKRS